jgi:hypothetical protein
MFSVGGKKVVDRFRSEACARQSDGLGGNLF